MADNTKFISLPPKQLVEPLSTSATTLYANNLDFDLDGTRALALSDLGDYGWIVIEPRSLEKREICKVTGVSGTQLTIARGYKPFSPYNQDTATWAKTHSVGVSFVFTNAPQMYDEFAVKDNDENITGTWTFDEDTRPLLDADLDTAVNEELVTYGQLYRTAISGAVNADETHKGNVEIPTTAEVTSGASTGGTGASVVPTAAQIAAQIQSGTWISGTTAGTADAITATLTPTATAYTHNMMFVLHITTANNAGCTLNVDGLGAKSVYKYAGGSAIAVEANDMKALYHHIFLYDSDADVFLLVNPASGTLTSAATTLASSFFATTAAQPLKTTLTAGHDLTAGELVAVESDGKMYRTRPKAIPGTNSANTTSTGEELGTSGKKMIFDTPTSGVHAILGRDAQAGAFVDLFKVTSSAPYGTAPSVSITSVSTADSSVVDAVVVSDFLLAAYNPGDVTLRALSDIDGTPTAGAELAIAGTDATGCAVSKTATANTYVAFANNTSNLLGYKITASGTTLTNAASATIVSGASVYPICAKNFDDTDYILLVYADGTNFKAIVGEYNTSTGAWTSVGSALTINSGSVGFSYPLSIEPISSTKALIVWHDSSDAKAVILTRSGTSLSASSTTTIISSVVASGGNFCLYRINTRQYILGSETTSGGKLQIFELDRDYSAISTIGSAATYGAGSNEGVGAAVITPDRILVFYESGTDTIFATQDLTSNIDCTVGFVDANVATDATEKVTHGGFVSALSGLTTGSMHFPAFNGSVTTSSLGSIPATTTLRPTVRPVIVGLSSTTGIKI